MKINALRSIGAICVVGLAVASIGWRIDRSQTSVPVESEQKLVYCNLDDLVACHPASKQLLVVQDLRNGPDRKVGSDNTQDLVVGNDFSIENTPADAWQGFRDELKTQLDKRYKDEMLKSREALYREMEKGLLDRKAELVAEFSAIESAAKRSSDSALSAGIRSVAENYNLEQLDAEIKLAALRSQMTAAGVDVIRVDSEAGRFKSQLDKVNLQIHSDEDSLRSKSTSELDALIAKNAVTMGSQLLELKNQESARIEKQLSAKRDRLRSEIDEDAMKGIEFLLNNAQVATKPIQGRREHSAVSSISCGKTRKASTLQSNAELKKRIMSELELLVKRIAQDNGIRVTFSPVDGVKDQTKWFKSNLPYFTGRKA